MNLQFSTSYHSQSSFPRKRESRALGPQPFPWTPAFAGVTITYREFILSQGLRIVPVPRYRHPLGRTLPRFALLGVGRTRRQNRDRPGER